MDVNITKYKDEKRLMGVSIKAPKCELFLLNVYMPTDSEDNLDDFVFYLYKIHTKHFLVSSLSIVCQCDKLYIVKLTVPETTSLFITLTCK
jgi:hypothetical protein